MPLVCCTPSPTPGRVAAGPPGIEVLQDAIYQPLRDPAVDRDRSWGIYDSAGRLVEAAAYYRGPGRLLVGQSPASVVAGCRAEAETFLYGGVFFDHFGHFILTSLARLWPFADPALRPRLERLPILFHAASEPATWFKHPHVAGLLGGLGLGPERFVRLSETTRVRRLIVPRPGLVEMSHVHPAFVALTRAIGRALAPAPDPGGPVWLSRSRLPVGTQGFDNETALEAALRRFGVAIVHPQEQPVAAQIGLFAGRPVVAGTVASSFLAALFCDRPAPMLMLSPSPIVNTSFGMLDAAAGHDARYLHVEADHHGIDMTRRLWSLFTLRDPERTGAALLAAMQRASLARAG